MQELSVEFSAPFEDVSLMKYLAEGTGNSDNLDFCLNYYSLPIQNRAYGIYALYNIFGDTLDEEEKKLYRDINCLVVLFDMEKAGVWWTHILNEFSKIQNGIKGLTERIINWRGKNSILILPFSWEKFSSKN
ncbi:MAG: hypothetical protein ACLRSW_09190 [Christensenellaceae bacterium]